MKNLLEICAANYSSAINAQIGGADRIELCVNLQEGGETPSYGLIKKVREALQIKLHVLIRPRPGSFVYTENEVDMMLMDIHACKTLGVDGVVIGALTRNGDIDIETTQKMMDAAGDMKITFHRAIDVTKDIIATVKKVNTMGIDTILTSGGKKKAIDGQDTIKKMHEISNGKTEIMAGSGINAQNIEQLASSTHIHTFHASASTVFSENVFHPNDLLFGEQNQSNEYQYFQSEVEKIKQLKQTLNQLTISN